MRRILGIGKSVQLLCKGNWTSFGRWNIGHWKEGKGHLKSGKLQLLDERETLTYFPFLAEGFSSVHVEGAARVDGRA